MTEMEFHSEQYLAFFAIVFSLYWLIPRTRLRTLLLVVASFVFYATWNWRLATLVFGFACFDYAAALAIEHAPSTQRKTLFLTTAITANLALLGYFKYANFFLTSFEHLLNNAGVGMTMPSLRVVLPIGISFFTFEAISYLVDVAKGRLVAERNLPRFLLFITFFPHLIAGPIVRARDFLPQIGRHKRWDWARVGLGVRLFAIGLLKKMAIADRMSLFADPVFADPKSYGTAAVWVATIAYAIQIYCDFSGYSDMAVGCAHLLGFKLPRNFNMPYLAQNVSEFWRRWHISLSNWLRDYVFIPLGGSRSGVARTAINLLITMGLGGLWHGASWTFVIWGVLHGAFLIVHRMFRSLCRSKPVCERISSTIGGSFFRWMLTFLAVAIAWIFFRCPTFGSAGAMLQALFVPRLGKTSPLPLESFWCLLAAVLIGHSLGSIARSPNRRLERFPAPAVGLGYAVMLTLTLVLAPTTNKVFIYFQF